MRALVSFSLILVAGILGTTIAHESHEIENDKVDKIEDIQYFLNRTFDLPHLDDLPDDMEIFDRLKCKLNGGPNADTEVIESWEILLNSITALNNETQQQLNDIANNQHTGMDSVVGTTCTWATTMNGLAKTFANSLKPCLGSSERSSVDLINDVTSAILEYICKDNGIRISAFLAADGESCIESSVLGIDGCMSSAFSENNTVIKRSDSLITPLWNIPIITINSQFCREFQNAQRCTVRVLRGCENSTTSHGANALFNILQQTLGCEALLKI